LIFGSIWSIPYLDEDELSLKKMIIRFLLFSLTTYFLIAPDYLHTVYSLLGETVMPTVSNSALYCSLMPHIFFFSVYSKKVYWKDSDIALKEWNWSNNWKYAIVFVFLLPSLFASSVYIKFNDNEVLVKNNAFKPVETFFYKTIWDAQLEEATHRDSKRSSNTTYTSVELNFSDYSGKTINVLDALSPHLGQAKYFCKIIGQFKLHNLDVKNFVYYPNTLVEEIKNQCGQSIKVIPEESINP
jgi:hypothetical protein